MEWQKGLKHRGTETQRGRENKEGGEQIGRESKEGGIAERKGKTERERRQGG
ncbi:MAG: hypothetical protein RL069_2387 [Planctomycetota bacterium]|jgi:hypothetical protein